MPPKRQFNDGSDETTEESTDETTEESTDEESSGTSEASLEVPINGPGGGAAGAPVAAAAVSAVDRSGGGRNITNNPHDEAFDVENDEDARVVTPGKAGGAGAASAAPAKTGRIVNNPHDEAFEVGDDEDTTTPTKTNAAAPAVAPAAVGVAGQKGMIKNASHDEFSDVSDDMDGESVETPTKNTSGQAVGAAAKGIAAVPTSGGQSIKNNPHDAVFEVEDAPSVGSPESMSPARERGGNTSTDATPARKQETTNVAPEEDSDDVSTDLSTDDDGDGNGGQPRMGEITAAAAAVNKGAHDYNPADYAHLNAKLPPDVVELFNLITAYQPQDMELPTKFRPFIPDFIPCVGEMDAFCKVPRPDSIPDNLGTIVVDEPSAKQSNPAVVMIGLGHITKVAAKSTFVDSLKNAHENPNAIDDWITQIKGLHGKKPLPTVNYSRPMPEIDVLLQAWPPEFEDIISSDIQFPPPQIDLDIEQYVRLLCSLLDIPIYNNVIESLHVMFTLYLEFRSNQHFQHA